MPSGSAIPKPGPTAFDGYQQTAIELGITQQSVEALAGLAANEAATKRAHALLEGDQIVALFRAPDITIWARFPVSSRSEADIDIAVNGKRTAGLLHWEAWAIEASLTEPEIAGVADLLQAVSAAIPEPR